MSSVITSSFNYHNAEQFKESLNENSSTKYYIVIGKTKNWTSDYPNAIHEQYNGPYEFIGSNTDGNVQSPYSSVQSFYIDWDDAIAAKKVSPGDVEFVTKLNTWTSNTGYYAYTHDNADMGDEQYYVLAGANKVYKCISNNYNKFGFGGSGISTVEPTGTGTSIIDTNDGYRWKFMYQLTTIQCRDFVTSNLDPNFIAVDRKRDIATEIFPIDDGTPQWDVENTVTDGAVHQVMIIDGGVYTSNANTVTIDILSGDGTGFSATCNIASNGSANLATDINITNVGVDYRYLQLSVNSIAYPNTTNAVFRGIISPPGGHGYNAIHELDAKYIMINTPLTNNESGMFVLGNDYRKISLLKNPIVSATSQVASNTAYDLRTKLSCVNNTVLGSFTNDERVVQGAASGTVVEYDATSNSIFIVGVNGAFTASATSVNGQSSLANSNGITSITNSDLKKGSGSILYMNHRSTSITRNVSQKESVQVVIQF